MTSKTLAEILDIPGYQLFLPHDIEEYERLQSLIVNRFYNREIAYDTVDYFRMRLNYYLEVNAPQYNKLLASEYVEFDPFMTDYREHTTEEIGSTQDATKEGIEGSRQSGESTSTGSVKRDRERYSGKDNTVGESNIVGTDVSGRLNSLAENISSDREFTEHKDYEEKLGQNVHSHSEKDYTENTVVDENIDHTINRQTDRDINRDTDAKQTARDWTERGTSKEHNLSVGSDTPQAMLFNVPNHYYGTGTADDFGEVVTDSDGNQHYQHYMEGDISAMDSEPRTINGGQTPWYNYASNANNNIGHDNYERSGTETFSRTQNDVTDDDVHMDESGNRILHRNTDVTGHETVDATETTDKWIKGSHDISDAESKLDSRTKNENEHEKTDSTESSNSQTTGRNSHVQYNRSDTGSSTQRSGIENEQRNREVNRKTDTSVNRKDSWSGRSMRSPSQLLIQYRNAAVFNADTWILDILERCFLQIF